MARRLSFLLGGQTLGGSPTKVDRKRLYGWSEIVALDDTGAECRLISVDQTGTLIIPKGGVGLGLTSADGRWVDRAQLQAVTSDGRPAVRQPSSYDAPVPLAKSDADELLSCSVTALYELDDPDDGLAQAIGGDVYAFDYFFRAGHTGSRAFLLANEGTVFMLVGHPNDFEYLSLNEAAAVDEVEEDEEDESDELDFSFT
jgi:hypothetical protein